ncbi:unnamed protein product [Polarella glacialis]|uniref:Uncharacterized protein n=1 Tax=Polarella glacialis TaxID=89957 RepID=A0A813FYX0_POLGL|nr:unnamed protein product [Polarella glacialis]
MATYFADQSGSCLGTLIEASVDGKVLAQIRSTTMDLGQRASGPYQWNPPLDTGGSPLEVYEVLLIEATRHARGRECMPSSSHKELPDAVPGERAEVPPPPRAHQVVQSPEPRHSFRGLRPGSGPHRVEVRARNLSSASLGPASWLEAFTAFAAPSAPTMLRARLLPGWARGATPPMQSFRTAAEGLVAEKGDADADVDVVKLEFRSPLSDGGREIETYIVFADEELPAQDSILAGLDADDVVKPGSLRLLCEVPAAAVAWSVERPYHRGT